MAEEKKKWYRSKTVIVNILVLLAMILQTQTGFIISPEEEIAVVTLINLVLRAITNQGIEA